MDELEKIQSFLDRVTPLINESSRLEHRLEDGDQWHPKKLDLISSFQLPEEDKDYLFKLIEDRHGQGGYFNAPPALELTNLVDDEIKKKEKVLADVEARLQTFRLLEAFGESGPQFILQTSIILQTNPTCKNMEIWTSVALITSFVSLLATMMTTFLKMPHLTETDRTGPFQTSKNLLIVGPVMILIATPRLLVLSIFFASVKYWVCGGILFFSIGLLM